MCLSATVGRELPTTLFEFPKVHARPRVGRTTVPGSGRPTGGVRRFSVFERPKKGCVDRNNWAYYETSSGGNEFTGARNYVISREIQPQRLRRFDEVLLRASGILFSIFHPSDPTTSDYTAGRYPPPVIESTGITLYNVRVPRVFNTRNQLTGNDTVNVNTHTLCALTRCRFMLGD